MEQALRYAPRRHGRIYRQLIARAGSDIVRYTMGGSNIVITNTLQASSDLLEKRSQIYSNRPARGATMLRDLCVPLIALGPHRAGTDPRRRCGFDWSIAFAQPDAFWRAQRTLFQREYGARGVARFRLAGTRHARAFLRSLLESPQDFFHHAR